MFSALLLTAAVGWAGDEAFKEDVYTVHPYEIKTTYDRVKDYTRFAVTFDNVVVQATNDVETDLHIGTYWSGSERTRFNDKMLMSISFTSTSESWEYLKSHSLAILGGNVRLKPEVKHDGDVEKGYVFESMSAKITFGEFKNLIKADVIEFAIGVNEFDLRGDQVLALRDITRRLEVDFAEAGKIEGEHLLLVRKRQMDLQAKMDKAMEKAREEVKKLPKRLRAERANKVAFGVLREELGPVLAKYHVSDKELGELASAYPEFSDNPRR
jgi:hypothetical protein